MTTKTKYYIGGALLLAALIYFFYVKPKKKENPTWSLLGGNGSLPKANSTGNGTIATQTAPIVADTNVSDTDPTLGTAAATTRIASISGVRSLTPTYPVNVRVEPITPCDGGYLHWDSFGGGTKVCRQGALA
jgi:hypothetical protein